ncbi:MAG: kelch repeat-containing protein [Planctomycetota bacterium]
MRLHILVTVSLLVSLTGTAAAQTQWLDRSPAFLPPATSWHNSAYDATRQRIVVFGGTNRRLEPQNLLREWDGSAWRVIEPSPPPPARATGSMAFDRGRGRCVYFGGIDAQIDPRGETFEWDGTTWRQIVTPNAPEARFAQDMAYDEARGEIVLFGGVSATAELRDTWTYDGVTWREESPSVRPPVVAHHRMVYDRQRQRVILFGGDREDFAGSSNETWAWDGSDWARLTPTRAPAARNNHAMAYDAVRDRVVLFGGQGDSVPVYLNDTWEWNGTEWEQRALSTAPAPRSLLAASYDEAREEVVLVGGWDGLSFVVYSDVWTYAPTVAASVTGVGAGCAGTAGIPVLAPVAGSRPWPGNTLQLSVSGGGTGAAVLLLGASDTSWLGAPLPITLPGAPGCSLLTSVDAVVSVGGGMISLPIPSEPGLVGGVFFGQAVVADPAANPLGLVVSAGIAAVVGSL